MPINSITCIEKHFLQVWSYTTWQNQTFEWLFSFHNSLNFTELKHGQIITLWTLLFLLKCRFVEELLWCLCPQLMVLMRLQTPFFNQMGPKSECVDKTPYICMLTKPLISLVTKHCCDLPSRDRDSPML